MNAKDACADGGSGERPDAGSADFAGDFRALAIAAFEREIAELDQRAASSYTDLAPRSPRAGPARRGESSVVLSVRLDPDELAALRRRAAAVGIRPSVLVRSLIRVAVQHESEGVAATVFDRLATAADELRALVG